MADPKKSYLEMSDEEMMNAGPDLSTPEVQEPGTADEANDDDAVTDAGAVSADATADDTADAADAGEDEQPGDGKEDPAAAGDEVAKASEAGDDAAKAGDAVSKDEQTPAQVDDEKAEKPEAAAIDYQAEYTRLTAPFKANGKEVQVANVDDAIALMQMGANYQKKMAAMKPHLKLLKMLEKNQLMGEDKINFLIDLDKKNPAAINKLLKDSGVDPLQIDLDKAGDYRPNSYKVDDREMDLDTALDSIQETASYNRTLEILGTKWDGPSKQVIADTPQLVKVINDHVASGIYDVISAEVERERMFGRLDGLSDLEAYRQIGDAIQARGGFKDLMQQSPKTPTAPVVIAPKPKSAQDDKLSAKKRAAAPSAPSAPSKQAEEFNPLALSDEAFSKIVSDRFK